MKNYLNVGIIIKTRGLKGVVKVKSTSYFASLRYKKGNKVYLVNEKENLINQVTIANYSNEGEFDYLTFKEISTIEEAQKYIGYCIQVNKDEIPPLEEGSYYFSDLVDLICVDEENKEFGKVIKVEDFTAQISLRVELKNKKNVLIPFVDFYIKEVDLENKKITIHLIEGLI